MTAFHLPLVSLYWMLLSLGLVIIPHIPRLPAWIAPTFILFALWRYLHARLQWPLPGTWLRLLLILLVVLGVAWSYRSLLGRDVGIALLILLLGLKLLELKTLREARLVCFLSYFLIITHFLYSQSIPTALYLMVVMLAATVTLVSLSDLNSQLNSLSRLRLAAALLLQAIPLMLALFVLFPRVDGPFWALPEDRRAGMSGLSDRMSPGSISSLSLSDEVAFRVKFDGPLPPPSQRYWRGAVLWETDGKAWQRGRGAGQGDAPLQFSGDPVRYTVTLEAHGQPWLYALEMPAAVPPELGRLSADYDLRSQHPIHSLKRYTLQSYPRYRTEFSTRIQADRQWQMGLRLPAGKHPRARALAAAWQEDNPEPGALVQRALRYFNEEAFRYTLEPPLLFNDPIDEFLFDTRAGFCEHYSAAFVTLMRAASVPARVVIGYQGGTLNPLNNYLVVRQRDAHAWAEVWLAERGWVRVDPTAAVSPSRVEMGIDTALPSPALLGMEGNAWLAESWRRLRYSWDALNNGWNQWVLGYGENRQRSLLAWLGLEHWDYTRLGLALISVLGILLGGVAIWLWRQQTHGRPSPALILYRRFCGKLARRGMVRRRGETVRQFAARAATARPDLAAQIDTISQHYLRLRYAEDGTQTQAALARAVRDFRP